MEKSPKLLGELRACIFRTYYVSIYVQLARYLCAVRARTLSSRWQADALQCAGQRSAVRRSENIGSHPVQK